MLTLATNIKWQETDSVLEALILEASLIKKYQPSYNTREKDDKSYWYVVITKENYPRVLMVRGRQLKKDLNVKYEIIRSFGPFPYVSELKTALKIIRKIFPYRDVCKPYEEKKGKKQIKDIRGCFNSQIGLCPGVCTGKITKKEYQLIIKKLILFLEGRKEKIIKGLDKEMKQLVKSQKFEEASRQRDKIFALRHIQDVALLKNVGEGLSRFGTDKKLVVNQNGTKTFRLEAYDISHFAGAGTVGAMAVWEGRELNKDEYRLFRLRGKSANKSDDLGNLKEILLRRFKHKQWSFPDLIVVDGGQTQLRAAKEILSQLGINLSLVSVVKNEKHHPREILGDQNTIKNYHREILATNADVHRFVLTFHRKKMRQMLK